jgi:hypothetical protein
MFIYHSGTFADQRSVRVPGSARNPPATQPDDERSHLMRTQIANSTVLGGLFGRAEHLDPHRKANAS